MIALYVGGYLLLVVVVLLTMVYYFKVIRPRDEAKWGP
jgi:hypothetical protein